MFYFSGGEAISPVINWMITNSVAKVRVDKIRYYINVEGRELPVYKNSSGQYKLSAPKVDSHQIESDMNSGVITVFKRVVPVEEVFDPRIPSNYLLLDNVWVSYLVDRSAKRIIGIYNGKANYDDLGRLYNQYSALTIHPHYTGRGLRTAFAQFTYHRVIEDLGIKYLNIHIVSAIPVGACKCYVSAAHRLGLQVFISSGADDNFSLLTNRDDCRRFYTDKETKLIITDGLNYDSYMAIAYNK